MSNYIVENILNKGKKFDLYSLQLANMIRIRENDVVYIFDEVGTGKTISAGLSIIELLFNSNNFKNVLIITDNSVLDQFQKKLKDILNLEVSTTDYKASGSNYKIKIINQVYSNIEKEVGKEYDFIIIDEAHSFLNKDTKRYKALIKLNAKKAMFLTATPIKNGKDDLDTYAELGARIISGKYGEIVFENKKRKLKEKIMWSVCDPELLCKSFDPYLPVTRYFKDVSRNLIIEYDKEKADFIDKYAKKPPIRLIPKVWDSRGFKDKYECIFNSITNIINKNSTEKSKENRFIIFTWYKDDIEKIASQFMKCDAFEKYNKNKISNKKTYFELSGGLRNKDEVIEVISSTEGMENLPTIIITTASTAEVGVDFPCYNYVVNYHINSSPSSTEQRFGRIDRMNSIHDELNMCFVIDSERLDSSSNNFLVSMTDYIEDLLKFLPSKNIVIADNTPAILRNKVNDIRNIYEEHKELCNKINIELIIEYLSLNKYDQILCEFEEKCSSKNIKDIYKLYNFMEFFKNDIIKCLDETRASELVQEMIYEKIETKVRKLKSQIEKINKLEKSSKSISNKILYSIDEDDSLKENEFYKITTMDSQKIYEEIGESKRYKFFKSEIINLLK